ncbi:MAG: peptidoglycan DD-metalloendopeptidase family protein [Herminiimonas sp.]|nr:peptidoglycan DD-metalloendopeptidase family protein [Herminiimonas sp.]
MKNLRLACLAVSVGFIAACSTTRTSAPIIDRTSGARAETPRVQPNQASVKTDMRGFYTVRRGDTLLHIALEFGQNYRDLVAWNNLANANDIKVDQVLRVAQPEPGSTISGVQTGSVASTGVEVRSLSNPPFVAAGSANGASGAAAPNKTGPRAEKRPYSETALAELQKPDAPGSNTVALAVPVKAESSRPAEPKIFDKPADNTPTASADDDSVSWIWPAEGKVISGFEDGRKGIDIAGKVGQNIVAAGSGKVMYAGSGIRGYGNLVIVKHTNNLLSAYAHNKSILVKEGQAVSRGQKIAEMGNSDSDAVKLHFEIRQQGKPVDPSKFLPNLK